MDADVGGWALMVVNRQVAWVAVAYICYVVGVTMVICLLTGPVDSLFSLGFWFGSRIELIAHGEPLGDALRLPFIPYFLGGLAWLWDDYVFALLVKNLIAQALLAYVIWRVWRGGERRFLVIVLIAYVLTFPQLVRHSFALIPEQGYQIAMLAFVFYGLVEARQGARWVGLIPFAVVTALAYLVQSSVVLIGPVFALLYFWRTRNLSVLALFAGTLAAAVLLWGVMNLTNTGQFAISSSADGFNFWKGNNEHTLEYFPLRTLDAISHLAPKMEDSETEWDWSAECFRRGLQFNLEHPWDGVKIMALRFYQVFLSVTGEESPSRFVGRAPLKVVGILYMVVFRVMLLIAVVCAVGSVLRFLRERTRRVALSSELQLALCYLMFLGAYMAPYLVAWGTERRLMPVVIPTCIYLLAVFERRQIDCVGAAHGAVLRRHVGLGAMTANRSDGFVSG